MFGFNKYRFEGFFKRSLQNMTSFWFNMDRANLLNQL